MNSKNELISTLSSQISYESNRILKQNVSKFVTSNDTLESDVRFRISSRAAKKKKTSSPVIKNMLSGSFIESDSRVVYSRVVYFYIVVFAIASVLLIFLGKLISPKLNISLLFAILFLIGIICFLIILFLVSRFIIKQTYRQLERRFDSIQIKEKEISNEFTDDVYIVIANTYESLSDFRKERERQAKNSYNAALGLIISGILIVFSGVYLLFRKSITEGALASSIGAISNIIGGTILKFYKDTNDRMDRLNSDLFILNSAKVQYALILKISDVKTRDNELGKLIISIGNIKNTNQTIKS